MQKGLMEIDDGHHSYAKPNAMAQLLPGKDASSKAIHVDFTPLVDLGFLLISFFVFTSALSQPAALQLIMPHQKGAGNPVKESGVLTLLPAEKGQVYYYEGRLSKATLRKCSMKAIRDVITGKKRRTPVKDFFVIITPLPVSDYASVIHLLDEMTITGSQRFAIVDADSATTASLGL